MLHNRKIWIDQIGLMPSAEGARNPSFFHRNTTYAATSVWEHTIGRFRAP